ncbi:MAG: DUF1517 domain-containing protein [Deltaproteobacteria bacterium]|nr:DUF1517 domain-containing protein [Deltaproteobacteria bacterium]
MFGFGKKKKEDRVAVATVALCVDGAGFLPLQRRVNDATARIVAADGAFDVAADEVAAVARALLDHESSWHSGALAGEVFAAEGDAQDFLGEVYADLSSRYASSDDGREDVERDGTSAERRCVVMVTVAYRGESVDVERDLHDRLDAARALQGIVALREQRTLLAAQVHVAPSHTDDRLSDEQLLANFPELSAL